MLSACRSPRFTLGYLDGCYSREHGPSKGGCPFLCGFQVVRELATEVPAPEAAHGLVLPRLRHGVRYHHRALFNGQFLGSSKGLTLNIHVWRKCHPPYWKYNEHTCLTQHVRNFTNLFRIILTLSVEMWYISIYFRASSHFSLDPEVEILCRCSSAYNNSFVVSLINFNVI